MACVQCLGVLGRRIAASCRSPTHVVTNDMRSSLGINAVSIGYNSIAHYLFKSTVRECRLAGSIRHRNAKLSADLNAICALSAAPACPPRCFRNTRQGGPQPAGRVFCGRPGARIVAGRGRHEYWRGISVRRNVLVWRIFRDRTSVIRDYRIAVFGHPRRRPAAGGTASCPAAARRRPARRTLRYSRWLKRPSGSPPLLPPRAPSCSAVVMRGSPNRLPGGEVLGDLVPALAHRLHCALGPYFRRRRRMLANTVVPPPNQPQPARTPSYVGVLDVSNPP